jgi:hypothetical protein
LNAITGIDFKIQDNIKLSATYTFPLEASHGPNLQFGINIKLLGRTPKGKSKRKKRLEVAHDQIEKLKSGFLLVRLKTSENSINALEKVGRVKKANRLQSKQEKENLKIINAFKYRFDFCDVYYFLSHDSEKVRRR